MDVCYSHQCPIDFFVNKANVPHVVKRILSSLSTADLQSLTLASAAAREACHKVCGKLQENHT